MNPNEPKPLRIFRRIAGTLMAIEASLLIPVAVALTVFILLLGGLATIVSGGNATEQHFKQVWLMILAMVLTPYVLVGLIILSSIYLLLGKRPLFVAIVCGIAAAVKAYAIWFILHEPPSHIQDYTSIVTVGMLVSLSGLVAAILMMSQKSSE